MLDQRSSKDAFWAQKDEQQQIFTYAC